MEKKAYKGRNISGVVCHIEDRDTRNGHYLAVVRVRTKEGKIHRCVLFNDDARRFIQRNFMDQQIYIEGRENDEGEISVKFFDGEGDNSRPQRGVGEIIKPEDRARFLKYLSDNDLVMVPHRISDARTELRSSRRKDCVCVNGKWELKIEYVMRVMGAKEVTEQLRGFGAGGRITNINPTEYRIKLLELVAFCAEKTGDYVKNGDKNEKEGRIQNDPGATDSGGASALGLPPQHTQVP